MHIQHTFDHAWPRNHMSFVLLEVMHVAWTFYSVPTYRRKDNMAYLALFQTFYCTIVGIPRYFGLLKGQPCNFNCTCMNMNMNMNMNISREIPAVRSTAVKKFYEFSCMRVYCLDR